MPERRIQIPSDVIERAEQATYDLERRYFERVYNVKIDLSKLSAKDFNSRLPAIRRAFELLRPESIQEFQQQQIEGHPVTFVFEDLGKLTEEPDGYHINVFGSAEDLGEMDLIAKELIARRAGATPNAIRDVDLDRAERQEQDLAKIEKEALEQDNNVVLDISNLTGAAFNSRAIDIRQAFSSLNPARREELRLLKDESAEKTINLIFENYGDDVRFEAPNKYHINVRRSSAEIQIDLEEIIDELIADRIAAEEARVAAEEEDRLLAEEEARIAEEARLRAEEEARQRANEEARIRADAEARVKEEARQRAEAEEARIREQVREHMREEFKNMQAETEKGRAATSAAETGSENKDWVDGEIVEEDEAEEKIVVPDNIEEMELSTLIDWLEEQSGATIFLAPGSKVDEQTERKALINLAHAIGDLGPVAVKNALYGNEIQLDTEWLIRHGSRKNLVYHVDAKAESKDFQDFFKGTRLSADNTRMAA